MIHAEIVNLLNRTTGLDATAIGSSTIERAVQDRRSACKLKDTQAYLEYVRASETELLELIEAVVVPETWFFRHHEAFVELSRLAWEEWLPAHPSSTLRLLSLPSSTGEEPYSMAMALLDAGFPAGRFQIDAVDISARVLALASRAEYGKNSFRGNDLAFRDRHFSMTGGRWRLSEAACTQVRFQQGNVFSDAFLPGHEIYDVIFCRNMLIYFDRPAQDRTVEVLRRLLKPKGRLFVGPSETSLLLGHSFVSAKVPRAFAFHQMVSAPTKIAPKPRNRVKAPHPGPVQSRLRKTETQSHRLVLHNRAPVEPKTESAIGIGAAALLADQGRLAEAEKSCLQQIREHGASAQALYLMGLIRDAGGNQEEAVHYYRKALYLDQDHQDALGHLALLLRKQGDMTGARLLRDRLKRAEREGR